MGFTLIELLVVIAIIAVLMAIIIPALNRIREQGDLTPNYVPTLIRELSTFFILQSARRSVAEPGGLQLAAKAAGVI